MRDKTQLFESKQRSMSDAELIEKAYKEIRTLASTYGNSHRMSIPPNINDTDMLLSELVRRYEKATTDKISILSDLGVLFSGYSDSPQAVHKDVIKQVYQIFKKYE